MAAVAGRLLWACAALLAAAEAGGLRASCLLVPLWPLLGNFQEVMSSPSPQIFSCEPAQTCPPHQVQ